MTLSPPAWQDCLPPDAEALAALARAARDALPAPFAAHAQAVTVAVADFASDAVCAELDIDDPFALTGLYDGTPLPEKLAGDQPTAPDTIWLYRRPILDEWVARGDVALGHLVAHVYLHELAHHFGWSDAEIARIAPWID